MNIITNIFVSLFYVGYIKFWPGTFSSIISLIILYPFVSLNLVNINIFIIFFLFIFLLSIFFIGKYSAYTKTHDSGIIVVDEFLGIYFILIFYNQIFVINSAITIFLILIFFRIFDIFKFFPANIIDKKMNNPFGVLLDDIVASIYTVIILYTINVFIK